VVGPARRRELSTILYYAARRPFVAFVASPPCRLAWPATASRTACPAASSAGRRRFGMPMPQRSASPLGAALPALDV